MISSTADGTVSGSDCEGPSSRIVVATHGRFAEGILNSFEMIVGGRGDIEALGAYLDPEVDYARTFRRLVSEHDYSARPLVVVTDLLGGSVNNEFMQLKAEYPFFLVAGLSLALLMGLALYPGRIDEGALRELVAQSRECVVFCGEELFSAGEDSDF